MNQSIPQNGLLIGLGDRVADLGKSGAIGLLFGIAGTIGMGILYFSGDHAVIAGSWMVGWYLWLTITMGMFGLSLLHHAIRPSWSLPFLRIWEAGGGPGNILLMGILFLPVMAAASSVYQWANPDLVPHDAILKFKQPYLNLPFWSIRVVGYFAIWIALSAFMRRSTLRQDENRDQALERGRSSWGAFGLVVFFLTYTFALIDILMSLEPRWYSTMHGPWQIVGSSLGALGLTAAIACVNAKREPYNEVVSPNVTKDWGNMMFTNTMFWAYTGVSQYLIFWNGNLPDTTQYFARRSFMMWNAIGMVTIVGQFLVPWLSLLSPRVKRYPYLLARMAGWIFVIHLVDAYLGVAPGLPASTQALTEGANSHTAPLIILTRAAGQHIWFDLIAFLAVGGFWLYAFSVQVRKAPLLVKYDHRLQEALTHAH